MNPETLQNLSPDDKKMMGIPDEEKNPYLDDKGREMPFSKEGLLNRNFGKNVEQPSQADFYSNGVLNRAKMYENRAESGSPATANENLDPSPKIENVQKTSNPNLAEKQPLTRDGAGKAETIYQEIIPNKNDARPLMAQLVEGLNGKSTDPEGDAFKLLEKRLDPNLSKGERFDKLRELMDEYRNYKGQSNS